jgi:putative hemolysin
LAKKALGLTQLQRLSEELSAEHPNARAFSRAALQRFGVQWQVEAAGLEGLRQVAGPCLVVANHPVGGREALLLHEILSSAREDYRILSNQLLGGIAAVRSKLILVDPFGGSAAAAMNQRPLREAWRYLAQGGLLGVFPAGEVSYWQAGERRVADRPWAPQVARLALGTASTVVPLYFKAQSSLALRSLAFIHPALKTPLLPRELLHGPARQIHATLGPPISADSLAQHSDPAAWLREQAYSLDPG